MARPSKIWFRKDRGTWYVRIDGKLYNLGKDKAAAEKQFHKLKSEDAPQPLTSQGAAVVLDAFLGWCKDNRAERTLDWYTMHIQSFLDSLPDQSIACTAIRPHHVTAWISPDWADSTKRGAMVAVSRAFNWAVKQGYLQHSPLKGLEKPAAGRREDWPTIAEVEAMIAVATEPFKSLLVFMSETGCRPQEAAAIEPRHCVNGRVEFPAKESKGKKYARVIYLTDKAAAVLKANGNRFTNRSGRRWTAYAINCRMRRISQKTGKHYPVYSIRHSRITHWLESGMDSLTAAKLAGHRDGTMIARVYGHAGEKSDFLERELRRLG